MSPSSTAVLRSLAALGLACAAFALPGLSEPPPAAAAAATLERGDRGTAVRKLQRALGIAADGEYGTETVRAVRRHQRANGLVADGVAGPETLRSLGLSARESLGGMAERLAKIRACESDGNYRANTGNGYYGAYQFSASTWRSVGGRGLPHEASPRTQDRLAARLMRTQGPSAWPNCA